MNSQLLVIGTLDATIKRFADENMPLIVSFLLLLKQAIYTAAESGADFFEEDRPFIFKKILGTTIQWDDRFFSISLHERDFQIERKAGYKVVAHPDKRFQLEKGDEIGQWLRENNTQMRPVMDFLHLVSQMETHFTQNQVCLYSADPTPIPEHASQLSVLALIGMNVWVSIQIVTDPEEN